MNMFVRFEIIHSNKRGKNEESRPCSEKGAMEIKRGKGLKEVGDGK